MLSLNKKNIYLIKEIDIFFIVRIVLNIFNYKNRYYNLKIKLFQAFLSTYITSCQDTMSILKILQF